MTSLCDYQQSLTGTTQIAEMSSRWGKVMALFPTHTATDMMSFSRLFFVLFFFFSWLLELPSWCVPSHYWWASMLICRQDTEEKECVPVCSACRLFVCQHVFSGYFSACLSLFLSVRKVYSTVHLRPVYYSDDHSATCSVFGRWCSDSYTWVGGERKKNPALLILLFFFFFTNPPLTLWFCGHRQRRIGG